MRIGYAKIGRAMPLAPDKWGEVGGDNEPPNLLHKLSRRWPEHEFVIIGRNSGEDTQALGFPPNVINPWVNMPKAGGLIHKQAGDDLELRTSLMYDLIRPWVDTLDAIIVWAGQHGTSNQPIPKVGTTDELTKPQESFVNYAGFLIRAINDWRSRDPFTRREVWLCADVRNYLKCRDLKYPPMGVLAQYDFSKQEKHYRWGDPADPAQFDRPDRRVSWSEPNVWIADHNYYYSRLELVGIPEDTVVNTDPTGRGHFGILINENRAYVRVGRKDIMRDWVLPLQPTWMHGKWGKESLAALGVDIQPTPWPTIWSKLATVRTTFTTPASGSGWATTKPWEAFAVGTVCFFHPDYDDQDHILRDAPDELRAWLRVTTPQQLRDRAQAVNADDNLWRWLVEMQRAHFDMAMAEGRCIETIGRWAGL